MNIPQDILDKEPGQVVGTFMKWDDFMERNVDFWPLPGEFDVHTKGHCERVLLLALKIAHLRGLSKRATTALCHASIFHDSRRKDNYMDTGHGDRAAEYYKEHCTKGEIVCDIEFMPEAYAAIKFHDRDDNLGEKYIRSEAPKVADGDSEQSVGEWIEVYHDFKDADALDRLRLGPWALDPKYLRTEEAKGLMDFAQELVNKTMDPEEYKKIMDATRPFANKFTNKE